MPVSQDKSPAVRHPGLDPGVVEDIHNQRSSLESKRPSMSVQDDIPVGGTRSGVASSSVMKEAAANNAVGGAEAERPAKRQKKAANGATASSSSTAAGGGGRKGSKVKGAPGGKGEEHASGGGDVEDPQYGKMEHRDHILLRPDTYVGTRQERKEKMLLLSADETKFEERTIRYCPALYKIFDEILVNAADHMQRDSNCDEIRVHIDPKDGSISVENNGSGIPVQMHKVQKIYIPELIFGNLLAGDNFNDDQQRVTGGRNGYGAKLTNIFSTKFELETVCAKHKMHYKQIWEKNMSIKGEPEIKPVATEDLASGKVKAFTRIKFWPDWTYFPQNDLTPDTVALFRKRVYDIAGSTDARATVFLDGRELPIRTFEDFVRMHIEEITPEKQEQMKQQLAAAKEKMKKEQEGVADPENPNVAADLEVDGNERVTGIIAREIIKYDSKGEKGDSQPLAWEVILAYNPYDEFHQVSFVNSIRTYKGGSHVSWIREQIRSIVKAKCVKEASKKKIRKDFVKDGDIDAEMYLFINALIVNPQFDSQSKESLNTKREQFKQQTGLGDQFKAEVEESGIVDSVLSYAEAAGKDDVAKVFAANVGPRNPDGSWGNIGKTRRLNDVPKLEDANMAGTKRSKECTLILTEGDSAKALAVAGLSIVGRDLYGVFPLRGKPLNVREAAVKDVAKNAEVKHIMKILGANPMQKPPPKIDDLRYGSVMIMADQDFDGSHIKGLLVNMFQQYYPHLLQDQSHNFLKEFITPIVKATKRRGDNAEPEVHEFYSIIAYEQWLEANEQGKGWELKYYKGLGTSTSKEAKAYFSDLPKHKIELMYEDRVGREVEASDDEDAPGGGDVNAANGDAAPKQKKMKRVFEDDDLIDLVFSGKRADDRKVWMNGSDDTLAVDTSSGKLTVKDFINREMVQFSKYDLRRAVPSVIDGLKPSQRKILFACFKRNLKSDIKVAQLSGYVSEKAAYHHGEVSLQGAIVKLAQTFVGSNNVNLLIPSGQFGSRLEGGEDHASARYIFTRLAKTARAIFPEADDPVLEYNMEEGLSIEPVSYYPVIPMILVNGCKGIGTGWSTEIPCFNPRDIVANVRRYIEGKPFVDMKPFYRGFTGSMELKGGADQFMGLDAATGATQMVESSALTYVNKGVIRETSRTQLAITELPIGVWTRKYKEKLQEMLQKDEKDKDFLLADMKEHHTDNTVHFILQLTPEKMLQAKQTGLHKAFSLTGQLGMSNMHAFGSDHQKINKYDSLADLLQEFCEAREKVYQKRKAHQLRKKQQEIMEMQAKAQFIQLVVDDVIDLEKKSQAELALELCARHFPKWKEIHPLDFADFPASKAKFPKEKIGKQEPTSSSSSSSFSGPAGGVAPMDVDGGNQQGSSSSTTATATDYGYLLKMKVHQLSEERALLLLQQLAKKEQEAEALEKVRPGDMWLADLDNVESALDDQDREDGKELQTALKMNKKVGSADEMTNQPCVLAMTQSGRIKQIVRNKVVPRAHLKNKVGKNFAAPNGLDALSASTSATPTTTGASSSSVGTKNKGNKNLPARPEETITTSAPDPVVKLLGCHNFDTVLYVLSDGMVISYPVISIKDDDAKKKLNHPPKPIQDFLSFQEPWRAPYLEQSEIADLRKAAGRSAVKDEANNAMEMDVDEGNTGGDDVNVADGAVVDGSSSSSSTTVRVVAMVPIGDDKAWEADSLLLLSREGMILKLKLSVEGIQKSLVRGLQMMKVRSGDELTHACLANEDDTLFIAKADGACLHTSVRALRFGNKGGTGMKAAFVKKVAVPKGSCGDKKDRQAYKRTAKAARVIAFDRVYNGGINFDKTAKVQDKDAYLKDQGISKPQPVQQASAYYAQWRVRTQQNTPSGPSLAHTVKKEESSTSTSKVKSEPLPELTSDADVLGNAEILLAAATTLPRKLRVAAGQIFPALSEADQAEWLQKQEADQGRYDREMSEYKAAIAAHKKTQLSNKFVKDASFGTKQGGGKLEYMLKPDYLYGNANAGAKEGPLVEEMKAAGLDANMFLTRVMWLRNVKYPTLSAEEKAEWEAKSAELFSERAAGAADEVRGRADSALSNADANGAPGGRVKDTQDEDAGEPTPGNDDDAEEDGKEDEDDENEDDEPAASSQDGEDDAESVAEGGTQSVTDSQAGPTYGRKATGADLKDKACVLCITKKGRGQRIPIERFSVLKKTNGGRSLKMEADDALVAVVVLHPDHFGNNQNRPAGASSGFGAGSSTTVTGEKLFSDDYMTQQKGQNAFNGFCHEVEEEVEEVVVPAVAKQEQVEDGAAAAAQAASTTQKVKRIVKKYVADPAGKFQIALMREGHVRSKKLWLELGEEEKAIWEAKAAAQNAKVSALSATSSFDEEAATPLLGGADSAAAASGISDAPASQNGANGTNNPPTTTLAALTKKKEQRAHHELLLLTSDGEAHRVIPTTIALSKGLRVAKSRSIAKLQGPNSSIIDASYSITWDVPERAADRKARLAAEKAEASREKLETVMEEEEEDEEEEEGGEF
ncbi:unnamed protein product [Amoebophrya sp. A25]|nr:unnamed protein product [Amoebophrya sp. A25]|eukprot:GSA25T00008787001.1